MKKHEGEEHFALYRKDALMSLNKITKALQSFP